MLTISLWTRQKYTNGTKARELIQLFVDEGGPFAPDRFDAREPVKKRLSTSNLGEAAELLVGTGQSGWILLKNSKTRAIVSLRWSEVSAAEWLMQLDENLVRTQKQVDSLVSFLTALCKTHPVFFGGGAIDAEWEAKNWLIEETVHSKRTVRLGVDVDACLPGIYWLTIFGNEVVQFFGREKLKSLPARRVVDLGDAGLMLLLGDRPTDRRLDQLVQEDQSLIQALGADYFFDIADRDRPCKSIPSQEGSLATLGVQAALGSTPMPQDTARTQHRASELNIGRYERETVDDPHLAKFENRPVLSVEGDQYEDIEVLAGDVVVYLHDEIPALFEFSRQALVELDNYFLHHPPNQAFKRNFLERQLLPAVGAYFGKVLVRQLGGRWVNRRIIGKTAVSVGRYQVLPFRVAFDVAHRGVSMTAVFDRLKEAV
jgi:hypothetical protein